MKQIMITLSWLILVSVYLACVLLMCSGMVTIMCSVLMIRILKLSIFLL